MVEQLGESRDGFFKVRNALSSHTTDGNSLYVTAKVFDFDAVPTEVQLDLVRVSMRQVDLVDCDNDRYSGCLSMLHSLNRLRHNRVIG